MRKMKLTTKRLCGIFILAALPFLANAQMYIDVQIAQPGVDECLSSSVNAMQQNNNLEVFPNPAKMSVNISWTNTQLKGNAEIVIFNHFGQKVYNQSVTKNGSFTTDIDITGLAKGIYFIKVSCNNDNAVQKLIVE